MDNNNLYSDFVDQIANYEFQKLLYSKFESSELPIISDSWVNCLKRVTEEKKPLILFLHDEKNEYSRKCCKLLHEKDVQDFISTNFLIVGLNLNKDDTQYAQNLAESIIIVHDAREHVINGTACILLIIPNVDSVKVQKELILNKENIEQNNCLIDNLKKVQKQMDWLIKEDDFSNMTSTKYQQWMYVELGDRDYDSFENDEHSKLKDKLLFAMFGPPKTLAGYKDKQIEEVDSIYKQIRLNNNKYSKWNDRIVIAFIYNCLEPTESEKKEKAKANKDYKHEQDFYPVPVFVIRKCKIKKEDREKKLNKKLCRLFVDGSGRVYDSWTKYLEENTLPPRKMIYPKDGKYQHCPKKEWYEDEVWLEDSCSPSCSKGTKFLKVMDVASGVTGFLSGAAVVASIFTPLAAVTIPYALIAGATTGVYAAGRGTGTLVDRSQHAQSIGITDAESRGAYLNIATGTFGLAGAGATTLLTTFARNGVNIGKGTLYTVNAINGANIVIAGTATANGFYDVYQQWVQEEQAPSSLTLLQLGSSLFFFGNSIVNFRLAGTIVQEVQTSTLNEIDVALRSNRQRKTFNKLLKETTRVKGNRQGRAEVISTMRNSDTSDILAVLTRSNKNFNKNGIRFSAEGGGISLNGVPVDILEFGNIPKSQHNMYFETFPPIPENHSTFATLNNTNSFVDNMQLNENLRGLFRLTDSANTTATINNILNYFKEDIQQKIIKISAKFMNLVDFNFIIQLKQLLSGDVKRNIITYVASFIKRCATDIQNIFESRLLNEDVKNVCKEFGFTNTHVGINDFINYVVDELTLDNSMMDTLLTEFRTWIASLIYTEEENDERKEKRHASPKKQKIDCSVCGGYYYTRK